MSGLSALLDLLAPRPCGACRADLPPALQGPLCAACLAALRPAAGRLCRRCHVPHGLPEDPCRRCRERLFAVDCIRAAFPYQAPVRELLHAYKYRGRRDAGEALAGWMAGLWRRHGELRESTGVVPVPLHPERLRERGFNQAEGLAAAVARTAGVPLVPSLRRTRPTAARWRLSRKDRLKDLEGAFRCLGPAPRRALLVDDVCTTGGTLEACARALRAAGAETVSAFVLARG
ncbi:MAG: ComF family protein [Elusimicrobia bacterium]|nr:ComF family protein [Elusimicrobiota bacterium]